MDTLRISIRYRPIRVAWVIGHGDFDAYRAAVRFSYALWGGRFNPILDIGDEKQCRRLIECFQPDLLWPVTTSPETQAFVSKFPHLRQPFLQDSIYLGGGGDRKHAQFLDLYNAIVHWSGRPRWRGLSSAGVALPTWDAGDPLADVFLAHFGDFPDPLITGIDLRSELKAATKAAEVALPINAPIQAAAIEPPGIPQFCRFNLEARWRTGVGHESPGFFIGDASFLADLAEYWNLRAADIPLFFVDRTKLDRYAEAVPAWAARVRGLAPQRANRSRDVAVWCRSGDDALARTLLPGQTLLQRRISEQVWNGLAVKVPDMCLGDSKDLGGISRGRGAPGITFRLAQKPFSADPWFHLQRLIASVSVSGYYADSQYTFSPPYLPEINEFCSRAMHVEPFGLRLERGRLGLITDVTSNDLTLWALRIDDLLREALLLAGFDSSPSNAGLTARQLVAQMGGLQGCRAFKIPGVRRLLRAHGPTASFTRKDALALIGARDPENPTASFDAHKGLYIEPREGAQLRTQDVFGYLVEKGLFRIGADLRCPNCRMTYWTPLDVLKQQVTCEMCGNSFDATRQLANDEQYRYRRSGVMGAERNAQGAVPVALTLQQLGANLHESMIGEMYSTGLDLKPQDGAHGPREVDFVWLMPRPHRHRIAVILGECKDHGPTRLEDFRRDVETLRHVADALPPDRFKTFALLSKLAPFTADEVEAARALNDKHRLRAILLTNDELEPYHFFERNKNPATGVQLAMTPEDLASATYSRYFRPLGDEAMIGQDE